MTSDILCLFHLGAVASFLYAFMPLKESSPGYASLHDLPNASVFLSSSNVRTSPEYLYTQSVSRLVFVVIDALRTDFVLSEDGPFNFPKLYKAMDERKVKIFPAVAHSPTVTMPRIKAITSGGIPGFIDMILNFNTTAFTEDNFITQSFRHMKRIVFYGDDTWIRLFPEHFIRYEGTTSFFVNDFTEVDNNVTTRLLPELKRDDWDILVLHYLGLDHIGHVHGPRSSLVRPKLLEMDDVIQRISSSLQQYDSISEEPSVLVVCGDHGMSDYGGHGGSSVSEISVPLIFVYSRPQPLSKRSQTVPQISLASTISTLLGLPIPKNNMANAIFDAFSFFDDLNLLYSALAVASQVHSLYTETVSAYQYSDGHISYEDAVLLHKQWLDNKNDTLKERVIETYSRAVLQMSDNLSSQMVDYDYPMIIGAIVVLWLVFAVELLENENSCKLKTSIRMVLVFVTYCLTLFAVNSLLHFKTRTLYSLPITLGIFIMPLNIMHLIKQRGILEYLGRKLKLTCLVDATFIVGWLLHSLSLLATSFIEEEHQTWYFLVQSLHVALTMHHLILHLSSVEETLVCGCAFLGSSSRRSVADGGKRHKLPLQPLNFVVLSSVLSRILRAWNQTGDKWAHLTDAKEWLNRPENDILLTVAVLTGLTLFLAIEIHRHTSRSKIMLPVLLVNVISLFCFHLANGELVFFFILSQDGRFVAARVSLVITVAIFTYGLYQLRYRQTPTGAQSIRTAWIILVLLLVRPHNVLLFSLMIIQEELISQSIDRLNSFGVIGLYLTFGMASFFQLGNSNNLSRIDVAAGYVASTEYNPILVGTLLYCHTYAGPVYWILCLFVRIFSGSDERRNQWASRLRWMIVTGRGLTVAILFTFVASQHQHLFVWSVFSPKLLYEGSHTVLLFCIISFTRLF